MGEGLPLWALHHRNDKLRASFHFLDIKDRNQLPTIGAALVQFAREMFSVEVSAREESEIRRNLERGVFPLSGHLVAKERRIKLPEQARSKISDLQSPSSDLRAKPIYKTTVAWIPANVRSQSIGVRALSISSVLLQHWESASSCDTILRALRKISGEPH